MDFKEGKNASQQSFGQDRGTSSQKTNISAATLLLIGSENGHVL